MKIKNQLLAAALCCFAIAAQAEKTDFARR